MIDPVAFQKRISPHPEYLQRLLEDTTIPDMTRCQLCASLLLSQWQHSRSFPTFHPPSFLLVNTGAEPDPCMQMARAVFRSNVPERRGPEKPRTDPSNGKQIAGKIEEAEHTLRHNIRFAKEFRETSEYGPDPIRWQMNADKESLEIRKTIFGTLKAGHYSRHVGKEFGVATDDSHRVSLWIESQKDLDNFKRDLGKPGSLFSKPRGYDRRYETCEKYVSILGSITCEQWSADLAENIVKLPAPVLFLPHEAGPDSKVHIDEFEFSKIMGIISAVEHSLKTKLAPIEFHSFPDNFRIYENVVRCRLRSMPADYEFHILNLIRQLCTRFQYLHSGILTIVDDDKKIMWREGFLPLLFDHAIRGIVMGVESLVFHGYGINFGKNLDIARKMLEHIRSEVSCTPRDLSRRFQKSDLETRNKLLVSFEREGLITRDGSRIRPVTCRDFLNAIPTRPLMPSQMIWIGGKTGNE